MVAGLRPDGETRWRAGCRAVLLVLLVAVPVVFDTSVRPAFALPKFTVVALGAVLVAGLAAVGHLVARRSPSRRRANGLGVAVLALLGWTAVSAVASDDPGTALVGARESLDGFVTLAALVTLFFAVSWSFDRSHVRTALAVLWFGGAGPVLLYAAVQLRDRVAGGGGWDPVAWRNWPGDDAIWSTLGNPNHLAGFLAVLLPVGVVLLVVGRSAAARALTAAMLVLLLVVVLVVASRGALLGGVVALAALAVWFRHQVRDRWRSVLLAGGGLAAVAAALTAVVAWSGHVERGGDELLRTGEGTTVALRLELWKTAWRIAEDNPVVGVGPDRFGASFDEFRSDRFVDVYGPDLLATDPHNVFLSHLATRGFPGLLTYLLVVVSAAVRLGRPGQRGPKSADGSVHERVDEEGAVLAAVAGALLAYLCQASFNRHEITLDLCF
ncbi:MAG: O-antigen ligase family protein, partial [Actinomycetota bacterium]|nr:O-antigen ligase family protein [Actinomycetota bacterium]